MQKSSVWRTLRTPGDFLTGRIYWDNFSSQLEASVNLDGQALAQPAHGFEYCRDVEKSGLLLGVTRKQGHGASKASILSDRKRHAVFRLA
jgi:hypothetical protein